LRPDRLEIVRNLPDVPRFLETRAMLLSNMDCEIRGPAGNFVVWQAEAGLMAIIGRPDPFLIRDALATCKHIVTLLAAPDQVRVAAAAAPQWEMSGAQRLVHVETRIQRPGLVRVRMLSPRDADAIPNLPGNIRTNVASAIRDGAASAAWIAGQPVCVCYTGWQTESLCDLAVFTQPHHRGKGYATAAAAYLISHIRSTGRLACWLSDESNTPSLNVARKLGFRLSGRVIVLRQPFVQEKDRHG
jgi:GNAT superfamily N-acetyltransferase